ncbi:YigZ family protein [Flavitalea sp. BT771]|uniref:IMPACT family protein n=1 Tax=Flavitalea sp. BT771 TaxID=3063329 RepID=UPI0026E3F5F5|nr:YigZ family protein [Flavitalea sp. BT771]MDO6429870.1 YigZ family protein [Flavitalea sp. BT771]MDV6218002.1 YigZ family protein [Flavitalea sp. BT771]
MTEQDFYYTIEKEATAEFKDRGSKFIGYAFPVNSVESFKEKLNEVKKLHPKATHHCFAYRLGLDGNTYRVSDDGEPSGSAGRPILGQIDSKELVNVLVVVVRYFGGTLLGVPGLINAYKSAAALALQTTPLVQRQVEQELIVQFDYTQLNEIMRVVKQYNGRVISQEMQLFCSMKLAVPRNRCTEINYILKELRNVEVSLVKAAG